jgi:hypothetical protein
MEPVIKLSILNCEYGNGKLVLGKLNIGVDKEIN